MDWLTKQKTYVWLIVVLIIINITTLLFLWLGRPQPPDMNRDKKPDMDKFLKNELGLNQEQDQKIKQLRETLFDTTSKINELIWTNKKLLHEESFKEFPDNEKVNTIAIEIGNLETQGEILRFNHFTQIGKVLNVEQLKKFRNLLGEKNKHKPEIMEGDRNSPPPPPPGEFPPPRL